jgi:hypothetical protein
MVGQSIEYDAEAIGTLMIIFRALAEFYASDDDHFIESFQIAAPG